MSTFILVGLAMAVIGFVGQFMAFMWMDSSGPIAEIGFVMSKLFYPGIALIVIVAVGSVLFDFFDITVSVG